MFNTYLERVWVWLSIVLYRATRESTWEVLTQAGITNSPGTNWLVCLYNKNLGQSWVLMTGTRKGLSWSWATSEELERAHRLGLCPTSSHVPLKGPRSRHDVTVLDEFKACQYLQEQELELLRWDPQSVLEGMAYRGRAIGGRDLLWPQPPVLLLTSSH